MRAVGGIGMLNATILGLALVTSPLQARALGPAGRGELAAVAVTLGLLPVIADVGLIQFAARAAARGIAPGRLVGSLVPIAAGIGLVIAALGPLIAHAVAGGRETVFWLVLAGALTMPLTLSATILSGINWGREDWRTWALVRAIPAFGLAIAYVALYAIGELTVVSAGVTIIALGLVSNLPLLSIARRSRPWRWKPNLAREGLRFGSRVWLATVASTANARLDQLMMTRLVSSAELGRYAVAVNVSTVQTGLISALMTVLYPRLSRGDRALAGRALRVTLAVTALGSAILIVLVDPAMPLIFGEPFASAVPMAQILLVAAVPQAGVSVLNGVLTGAGRPGSVGKAQLVSLAITVPALVAFVGETGGQGAAVISLIAYSVTFIYLLVTANRAVGLEWRTMLVPHRSDVALLYSIGPLRYVGRRLGRRTSAARSRNRDSGEG